MMADHAGKTVAEVLSEKKGSVRSAPLPQGSPSWNEILHMPWEEVVENARERKPGFQTIKKLLAGKEYDK